MTPPGRPHDCDTCGSWRSLSSGWPAISRTRVVCTRSAHPDDPIHYNAAKTHWWTRDDQRPHNTEFVPIPHTTHEPIPRPETDNRAANLPEDANPTTVWRYHRRPQNVAAIQWTGTNWTDTLDFTRRYIGTDDHIGVQNIRDPDWPAQATSNYVELHAYDHHDRRISLLDVGPGQWLVVDLDTPYGTPPTITVMEASAFHAAYLPD